jgi:hypothetical protein
MGKQFVFDKIKLNGFTYEQYLQLTIDDSEKKLPENASELIKGRHSILKLNIQRMKRIEKTYSVSGEMLQQLSSIKENQMWLLISEPWCGDSAQIVPRIVKIAEMNSSIELKILLRDENTEVMDLYLTNGTISIPKLIAFDENYNEVFQWGPRPAAAQKIASSLKSAGIEKAEINKELQLWYGRDCGREIEKEISELVKTASQQLKLTEQ